MQTPPRARFRSPRGQRNPCPPPRVRCQLPRSRRNPRRLRSVRGNSRWTWGSLREPRNLRRSREPRSPRRLRSVRGNSRWTWGSLREPQNPCLPLCVPRKLRRMQTPPLVHCRLPRSWRNPRRLRSVRGNSRWTCGSLGTPRNLRRSREPRSPRRLRSVRGSSCRMRGLLREPQNPCLPRRVPRKLRRMQTPPLVHCRLPRSRRNPRRLRSVRGNSRWTWGSLREPRSPRRQRSVRGNFRRTRGLPREPRNRSSSRRS